MQQVIPITTRQTKADEEYAALLLGARAVCEIATEPMAICEAATSFADPQVIFVNAAFLRLVASTKAEYVGRRAIFEDARSVTESDAWPRRIEIARGDGTPVAIDMWCRPIIAKTGRIRHVAVTCSALAPERSSLRKRGRTKGRSFTALRRELREHKLVERLLLEAASRDSLTGLPNRLLFLEYAKEALGRLRRSPGTVSVLFIDCDRFKLVNDTFGHLVGDMLLIEVSRRLKECLRSTDVLARIGGDEFVALLESSGKRSTAVATAQRLARSLGTSFRCANEEFYLTASVGLAETTTGVEPAHELMRNADIAMYRAKEKGGDGYEIFSTELHEQLKRRRTLESDLRHAIETSEIFVSYQPIVMLADGSLVALEALARWQHPLLGSISPDEFIPIAEESQLIVELGDWMLRAACAATSAWQRAYVAARDVPVSVNVSVKQLLDERFSRRVAGALMSTGLRAESLRLELTETSLMGDTALASHLLQRLRDMGVHAHVDDFGTGFASLTYLQRLPITTLKIDRSFVSGSGVGLANPRIVEMVIGLAKHLGIEVIAEGIESAEQASALKVLGCKYGQGFYFSQPLANDRLDLYLAGLT